MSSLYGYSAGNPFLRPSTEIPKDTFTVNVGNIYDALDNKFSVFKNVINNSVLYKNILNDDRCVTLLIPPDEVLPNNVKIALLRLERDEATDLLSHHVFDSAIELQDNHYYQTKHLGVLIARLGNNLTLPKGESSQTIRLLNNGSKFKNGYVYVIDKPIILGI